MGSVAVSYRNLFSCSNFSRVVLALLVCVLLTAASCEKKRPPGYLSLGKVTVIAAVSGFLPDMQVYIHRDERGLSVMSTLCSYDLSPLRLVEEGGGKMFVSDYTTSRYDLTGHVLQGPADRDLSFYSARIDAGEYDGAKDTLYVDFSKEVTRDWRLSVSP